MLEIRNLTKSFGEKQVLKGVRFNVEPGAAIGLLGRNGAGKTTIIRIIMDLIRSDSGEVLINGESNRNTKARIGYLPEERGLYPKRLVKDQMAYIGQLRGVPAKVAEKRSQELLERLEAIEYYDKILDTLSKGNQQKIQLAICLINDPDIVILDEPFSGLDPVNARLLKDVVGETIKKGKLVLFSSHEMALIEEFCTEINILNNGEIALSGVVRDIKKSYNSKTVSIIPEHNPQKFADELKQQFSAFTDIQIQSEKVTVQLKNRTDHKDLLKVVGGMDYAVENIGIVEPTLEQIFIDKVGGEK
jgi:ABC-2 type transport system ATP-binding protein